CRGRACRARELQRVSDDRARGEEIPRAMLVEFRELLPRPGIEQVTLACGIPQLARAVPTSGALLPPRQTTPDPVRGVAVEAGVERRTIAGEATVGIDRLPQSAQPRPLLGAKRGRVAQRGAKPADERGERQDVIAVVGEDARQRTGP